MKLLLVDDEEYSREGILSLIPWKKLGISEIQTAENGREGILLAKTFRPDIVLADVKMPYIDGLTMCNDIRSFLPHCNFIIISGYSDKEYLKSAIRLSAINYLEKPFHPEELVESLKQAITKSAFYVSEEQSLKRQQNDMENNIVLSLLRKKPAEDPLWSKIREFSPSCPVQGGWVTLLISVNMRSSSFPEIPEALRAEILSELRCHIMKKAHFDYFLGIKEEHIIVLHLSCEQNPRNNIRLRSLHQELDRLISEKNLSYNIGVGLLVEHMSCIYLSYEAAAVCLNQSFFSGPGHMIFSEDAVPSAVYSFSPGELEEFSALLKRADAQEAVIYLKKICDNLRGCTYTLISTVKDFFSQVVRRMYYFSDSFIISSFSSRESLSDSINSIWNFSYLEEIETYLCERVTALLTEVLGTAQDFQENPLSGKIKNYIDANYDNPDLCLQNLADHFNITASYICIVFKRQYQKTINQYINGKRIEHSIDYLKHSNKKIKDISTLVGFQDTNYFIKVFKKITGTTPKEYRRQ